VSFVATGIMDLPRNGGWLCLDFTNTVEPRHGPPERDWLHGYPDLIEWARHVGTVDTATAARLLREAEAEPQAAETHFRAAIDLRESAFRVFAAVADGVAPATDDLDAVRDAHVAALRRARLVQPDDTFDWSWGEDSLDRPWWPVAVSAVELLTHGPLERVKRCPAEGGCSWLFVDATKNRSRRWCSMDDCGADVKAKRQTARRRARRETAPA
jgi:predicted RNA-binding Zn ribbon-like protein